MRCQMYFLICRCQRSFKVLIQTAGAIIPSFFQQTIVHRYKPLQSFWMYFLEPSLKKIGSLPRAITQRSKSVHQVFLGHHKIIMTWWLLGLLSDSKVWLGFNTCCVECVSVCLQKAERQRGGWINCQSLSHSLRFWKPVIQTDGGKTRQIPWATQNWHHFHIIVTLHQ